VCARWLLTNHVALCPSTHSRRAQSVTLQASIARAPARSLAHAQPPRPQNTQTRGASCCRARCWRFQLEPAGPCPTTPTMASQASRSPTSAAACLSRWGLRGGVPRGWGLTGQVGTDAARDLRTCWGVCMQRALEVRLWSMRAPQLLQLCRGAHIVMRPYKHFLPRWSPHSAAATRSPPVLAGWQPATCQTRPATRNPCRDMHLAPCNPQRMLQHAPCALQPAAHAATCTLRLATCSACRNMHPAPCNMQRIPQHAPCTLQHAAHAITCTLRPATRSACCNMHPAPCNTQRIPQHATFSALRDLRPALAGREQVLRRAAAGQQAPRHAHHVCGRRCPLPRQHTQPQWGSGRAGPRGATQVRPPGAHGDAC